MSWLGGSISSLTGQLTNFTKEVLAEGREEVSDHTTELSLAQQKTRELEIQCMAQKQEVTRTYATNKELEERANAAELQISSLTKDYRSRLQEKEDEIRKLQQQQLEMEEMYEKMLSRTNTEGLGSPGFHSKGGTSVFPSVDAMDFGDVISSQHEINRLSDTVNRLRAERDYWKNLSSSAKGLSDDGSLPSSNVPGVDENRELEARNKELERRLHQLIDEHQRELSTVQDVCAEKINQTKKSYKLQISQLQEQLDNFTTDAGFDSTDRDTTQLQLRQQLSQLQIDLQRRDTELEQVRGTLRERERALQLLGRQLEKLQSEKNDLEQSQSQVGELQKIINRLQESEADLRQQLNLAQESLKSHESRIAELKCDENEDINSLKCKLEAAEAKISKLLHEYDQASNSEMLLEVQLARHKFANKSDARNMQLLKEKQDLANRMAQVSMRGVDVQENVDASQEDYENLSAEVKQLVEKIGDSEHQQLIAGIIHTLELENNILKEQNLALQKHVREGRSEKVEEVCDDSEAVAHHSIMREFSISRTTNRSERSASVKSTDYQFGGEFDECETSSLMSSYSELSQRNKELDDQLKTLQSQIDVYERDIEQFEMVKADWQVERESLEELLDKTRSQLRAKETSLTLVTAQRGLLEVKKQSPRASREKSGDTELNFEQGLEKLQEQIEELSQSSAQLESERDLLLIEKEKYLEDLYKSNKLNENLENELSQLRPNSQNLIEMQEKIRELEANVETMTVERETLVNSLEELDKQHQIAMDHILQSRNTAQKNFREAESKIETLENQLKINNQDLANKQEKLDALQIEVAQIPILEEKIANMNSNNQGVLETEILNLERQLENSEKAKNTVTNEILMALGKSDVIVNSWTDLSNVVIDGLKEFENVIKNLEMEKSDMEKQLELIQDRKTDLEHELELNERALESFQNESALSKDEPNRSLWEVESWEDIADETTKSEKEKSLIKSTTTLQDMELESTSSKHSKDSSDDGQEKYGELVQRKEDLEIQVKELENKVSELQQQKDAIILPEQKTDDEITIFEEKLKLEKELLELQGIVANYELQMEQLRQEINELKENSQVNALTAELEEKTKQLVAMKDILKVYKDNFDSDDGEKKHYEQSKLIAEKDKQIQQLREELEKSQKKINEKENVWWTEEQHRNLQREKEQILSVLNEKSRENSSLKAEVHRLTSIVAAERCALEKLQQDTQYLLKQNQIGQAEASEMTKEAVQGLRRKIRDKELEIEALNQKNKTLIAVLQETPSVESNQLQTVLEERENLSKQVGMYLSEREQIINALHQKHQESTAYHAEIQRLTSALYHEHEKFDNLEQQHSSIAKQYEDKQKTLLNTQNEMIILKQRVTELEEQQLDLKEKYTELLEKETDYDKLDKVEIATKDLKAKEEQIKQLIKSNQDKDQWLFEKDKLLLQHQQRIQRVEEESNRKDDDVKSLKRQIEHLTVQMSAFQKELSTQHERFEVDKQKIEDVQGEANALKETNSRLCLVIQEKDFELTALKEKVVTLTLLVEDKSKNNTSSSAEMTRILSESEAMQQKAQQFQQERDQVMASLNQKQSENKQLHSELMNVREREQKLRQEVERLRQHLLEVEESYTQEAIHAEEREKGLRDRLAIAEDRIRNAASSFNNASFQANLQVESLQEQLHAVAKQRDSSLLKLDQAEDQIQQLTASLQTFQVVLEQFQQEKERELFNVNSQFEERLKVEMRAKEQLNIQIQVLEQKVEEAKEALAAASRLSETLDQREEIISSLKREVSDREASLKKIQAEMGKIASSTEGKVDRTIIKNLLINYFTIPSRQQPQVLRIIATVLDFNYEERVKAGLETSGGWISTLLGQSPSPQSTGTKQRHSQVKIPSANQTPSLSAAFIQFLETESRPAFTMKLPAESMAQEVTRKIDNKNINPFTLTAGAVPHVMTLEGDSSHLLMKPMTATLPVFTPVPVTNVGADVATNVLRDVLKED